MPTITAATRTTLLPADSFPHIIDAIFAAAPPLALLSLRTACSSWRARADALLVSHLRFDGVSFLIPSPSPHETSFAVSAPTLRVPAPDWLSTPLTHAVRTLDIAPLPPHQPVQPSRLAPATRFRSLRTARIARVLDYWEHGLFEVDTVVLPVGALRAGHFDLLRKQVRTRIVAHIPSAWPERLFADLGVILKFGRATELVLVFSHEPQSHPSQTDEDEGGGYALGLAAARGLSDSMTSDPLAAADAAWPHLHGRRGLRIDIVNSGRARHDWEGAGRRATEWRLWRRYEAKHPEAAREEMLDAAHKIIRFFSLEEYADEVGAAYATEMCF
ncbi:unnamed protein product [Cutaneotrichosporon oleaginosum]